MGCSANLLRGRREHRSVGEQEYTYVRGRFIGHRVLSVGDRLEGEHWRRNMKFRGEVRSFFSLSLFSNLKDDVQIRIIKMKFIY